MFYLLALRAGLGMPKNPPFTFNYHCICSFINYMVLSTDSDMLIQCQHAGKSAYQFPLFQQLPSILSTSHNCMVHALLGGMSCNAIYKKLAHFIFHLIHDKQHNGSWKVTSITVPLQQVAYIAICLFLIFHQMLGMHACKHHTNLKICPQCGAQKLNIKKISSHQQTQWPFPHTTLMGISVWGLFWMLAPNISSGSFSMYLHSGVGHHFMSFWEPTKPLRLSSLYFLNRYPGINVNRTS